MTYPLGPFQLIRRVGRGGMGVVWLGKHVEQDVPVAIKVIQPRPGRSSALNRKAFQQEVRAVGALDHPGVVWIFDSGVLPAEIAAAREPDLQPGSPFLVMEYASHGTLRQLARPPEWPELKSLLLALLDALAHAHARGVLHRDLKPDNVLIAGHEDLRPGFKITDFGIAHLLRRTARPESRPVGTPQYMAPEQVRSDTELYGPHTDLYALGSMIWRVTTGKLPHHGLKGAPLLWAQLTKDPPKLEPLMKVPDGFEDFLRTLLRKEPHERFQRAADAAVALARMPDGGDSVITGAFRLRSPDQRDGRPLDLDTGTLEILVGSTPRLGVPIDPSVRPTLPTTWRLPPSAPPRPMRLLGAGMGLFGIRPVPFVGREAERDALWAALQQVHRESKPRVMVVRGPTGVGKTRLVQWVADRAHEVGAAHVLRVTLTRSKDGGETLVQSTMRLLRTMPWPAEDAVRDLLQRDLGEEDFYDAVEDMLSVEGTGDGRRETRLLRVLSWIARDRPLFVMLDDAARSLTALRLTQLVVESPGHAQHMMVVLTALEHEPHRELSSLLEQPSVTPLRLAALDRDARTELARQLMGLDPRLADAVAERTGGNPLFAVQLVRGWVDQNLLQPSPSGFVLRDPAQALPRTLREVWDGRVGELVRGLDAPALELLERAAVLGRSVDILEWQAACDDPDGAHASIGMLFFRPQHARLRQQIMARLMARGLAAETEEGFVFANEEFATALVEWSKQAGRFKAHALACGRTLQPRPGDAGRVGRYLVLAGRPHEALDALLDGAREARQAGRIDEAKDLLAMAETAARSEPADGPSAASAAQVAPKLGVARAALLRAVGDLAGAAATAREAATAAERGDWPRLAGEAYHLLGRIAGAAGRVDEAEAHYERVVALLEPEGPVRRRLHAWHQLWRLAHRRRDGAAAAVRADRLREVAQSAEDPYLRAFGELAVAESLLARRAYVDAVTHATRSLHTSQALRDPAGQARALDILAKAHEGNGALAEARDGLSSCVAFLRELGNPSVTLYCCRLAHLDGRLGDFERAERLIRSVLDDGEPQQPRERSAVYITLAMAAAGRRRWAAFDRDMDTCEAVFEEVTEREHLEVAALAGDLAAQGQQTDRARRAWRLAVEGYAALGRTREVEVLQRKLRGRG